MKKNIKFIISWIMYIIGFIDYVIFLNLTKSVSDEAWWYTIGASFGVLLFCIGIFNTLEYLKEN